MRSRRFSTWFKRCNKYIDETMPWALAKDQAKKDRLETVLWNLIQGISAGAVLLESFMPSTSEKRYWNSSEAGM